MYKIFTSFLVTSFLTTAFFCSCTGSTESSLDTINHHDDCCDSPQGKTNHSSDKHCDCYISKVVNADITSKTVLPSPRNSLQQSFILNALFSNKNIDVKRKLIYVHGPPGPIAVVPLYIQFHTFRI
jgi:hypothetical protein